ncbi:hypothetical protein O6H91_06G008200 [Diphasiastrum complanatum]|uniref:Uncharacterized protein n=2 Tax=Diphasiastrum complanatum TaxID=34168 RepID=A0ACC2DAG0_DIPCM|nr:hypothetical protein O6H91_06G008200 [Diphasiastrum complanatum]KAJ7551281.1 hypothetical protein O6H91_06G008200 [Diphasiastrum complanatum]
MIGSVRWRMLRGKLELRKRNLVSRFLALTPGSQLGCFQNHNPRSVGEFRICSIANGRYLINKKLSKDIKDPPSRFSLGTLTAQYADLLQGCADRRDVAEGKAVHADIIRVGLESNRFLANHLVHMYGKCGSLQDARAVFDSICDPNVYSWTSMIGAYAHHGYGNEALNLFRQMQNACVRPDKVTLVTALNACCNQEAKKEGVLIHSQVMESGLESDIVVACGLLNMYRRCGSLEDVWGIFTKMHERDVIVWNVMIAACIEHEHSKQAVQLFGQMQLEGTIPNQITFIGILGTFSAPDDVAEGALLHAHIAKAGYEEDVFVGTALVNMYGKCGSLEDSRYVFDRMPEKNVVSWNAMLSVYAQSGNDREVLHLFEQMQKDMKPDKVTFLNVLDAYGNLSALRYGKHIHSLIEAGKLQTDLTIGNALISMYAKCGSVENARKVFDSMIERDVISWNTMIAAYGQHGYGEEALQLFRSMQKSHVLPSKITFVNILSACSHAGLLDEGHKIFSSMSADYGLPPALEHYGCMVDLLGRLGQLDEAENILKQMPFPADSLVYMTLLGACRLHGDVERGKRVAEHLFQIDARKSAPYVVLSNIYAATGRWDDVYRVRQKMIDRGVKKEPGCSSIVVKNRVHDFVVGKSSHPRFRDIFVELETLTRKMKRLGYVPDTQLVLHDIEGEQKEHLLSHHSEKLAVTFGIINTPPQTPIQVVKNLRVCEDCHNAVKFISVITRREIVLRDTHRFHRFKDGMCSCGNFW